MDNGRELGCGRNMKVMGRTVMARRKFVMETKGVTGEKQERIAVRRRPMG